MSWTEERVSLLKELWGDGHTAAEIAKKLGGVTRNAVIGKAHRLKLSNRVSPIQQNKKPANKNNKRKSIEKKSKTSSPRIDAQEDSIVKNTYLASDNLYNLMDLKPRMCRWPSGDPKEEEFGFCGGRTVSGIPYCEEHAKLAYQAATRNRILNADKDLEKLDSSNDDTKTKRVSSN